MANIAFNVLEKLDEEKSEEVERIFEAYNLDQDVTPYTRQYFAVEIQDGDHFVGAVDGYIAWEWMHIQRTVIKKEYRGHGYGRKLLELAEQEARKHKCIGIYLSTMSFQASDFYKKAGFEEYGRRDNNPPGHSRILFKKKLSCRT